MAKSRPGKKFVPIGAQCDCERRTYAMSISDITCDGCSAEADGDWRGSSDFVHLRIAGSIDINGRVLWHSGKLVKIGFFGQIHPMVVEQLGRAA